MTGGKEPIWRHWPLIALAITGLVAWGAMTERVDALQRENTKTEAWLIRIDGKIDSLRKDLFDALVRQGP